MIACDEIEPKTREWDGIGSAVAYVMSQNLARRHLTPAEEAFAVAQALPLYEAEARKRMLAGVRDPSANLREGSGKADVGAHLADGFGRCRSLVLGTFPQICGKVSPRTVESAAARRVRQICLTLVRPERRELGRASGSGWSGLVDGA